MQKPKLRMHADGQVSVYLGDGFANFISGLGEGNVKARGNTYVDPIPSHELEVAYRTSTWFGKIVDIPAEDATREWRTWQLKANEVTKVEAEERRLGVKSKVRQALIWQRLYGGAGLILGVPGDPSLEITPSRLPSGSLKFLTVVTKDELVPGPVRRNPLDSFYGLPEYFEIQSETQGQIRIHPSRVVPFRGVQVSPLSALQDFWGDPIWYRLQDAVMSADSSGAILDALLQEAKVDVIRVSNMMANLASAEYESLMIRRFQMVAILKGMQNVMMLDKDDEWEQKQITWTGLPDVAKHILNILSGSSNIPMFRLTGQNLTGLAGTGDAETRAYYDDVRSDQNTNLRPVLDPMDQLLVQSALGGFPEGTWYEWTSLYQLTDKEKAEIDKMEADTASVYATLGLVPSKALAKAVQARMVDSGRWPALAQALEEFPEEEEDDGDDEELAAQISKARGNGGKGGQDPESETPARSKLKVVGDATTPRTLYVSRDVLNWEEIAAHYKDQGFKTTVGKDMHVTIAYSRTPVDWMEVGSSYEGKITVPEGGPRLMEAFGSNGEAKVLCFTAWELTYRHQRILEAGASWDHGDYSAHITISYLGPEDLDEVEPWEGEIVLGPERFAEIEENWAENLVEDKAGKS